MPNPGWLKHEILGLPFVRLGDRGLSPGLALQFSPFIHFETLTLWRAGGGFACC